MLLSFAGRALMTWSTATLGGITFHALVDRPPELGSGSVVLLGFGAGSGEYKGQLCAFDAKGPYDRPIWKNGVDDDQLPLILTGTDPIRRTFEPNCGLAADVLPDNPGQEIVAVFSNIYSQRAIRIYALDGTLLYQVWQDGGAEDVVWLSGPRLLVFLGADETLKWDPGSRITHAQCLFALRPAYKTITREFLQMSRGDGGPRPVWLRYLHPPASDGLKWVARLYSATGKYDPTRYAQVMFNFVAPDGVLGGIGFVFDHNGQEVRGTRQVGDAYKKHPERFPPAEIFQLRDEPPTDIWRPATRPAGD